MRITRRPDNTIFESAYLCVQHTPGHDRAVGSAWRGKARTLSFSDPIHGIGDMFAMNRFAIRALGERLLELATELDAECHT